MNHQNEPMQDLSPPVRSRQQEITNSVTHGIGLILSLLGAIVLIAMVRGHRDVWRMAGCGVYVTSLVAVYTASTLSHSAFDPRWRGLFRILDQGFIYVLIAATYTPFSLVYLRSWPWWLFLAAMWAVALFGFFSKVLFAHRVEAVSVWIYVVLGWMPVISAPSLIGIVPGIALWWMLVGGMCYTVGTLFLIYDKKVEYFHAIWHLFVIAGSALHFVAILLAVARVR